MLRCRALALACAVAAAACVELRGIEAPRPLSEAELGALVASLALEPDAPVVVAVADIARCEELEPARSTARIAAAVIGAVPSTVVITMGDHAYDAGTREELERCYGPTWGRFNDITFPSPGNHDYETDGGAPYYDYFAYYRRHPAARARGYYSFEIGTWQLLSLNSLLPVEDGSAQLAWLEQTLAGSDRRCTLAYWHHPRVSSGWHGLWPWDRGRDMDDAWRTLRAHGVDAVVAGHDHIYERFAPQDGDLTPDALGIRQFIAGTGGGKQQPLQWRRRNSEFLYRGYGVLVLTLHDGAYEWAFAGVDGSIHDRSAVPAPCV